MKKERLRKRGSWRDSERERERWGKERWGMRNVQRNLKEI